MKIHFTILKDYLMNETEPRVKYGIFENYIELYNYITIEYIISLGSCNFDLFGFVCRRSLKEGFVYKGNLKLQDVWSSSWVHITTTDILL
jgi:hypothetical protein